MKWPLKSWKEVTLCQQVKTNQAHSLPKNTMNRIKVLIGFFVAISALLLTTLSPCFAEDCPETSGSMLFHAQKYIKRYEIAKFESFSESEQEKIFEKTKSKCAHITQLGPNTYSVLFKNKKTNSYIVIVASAYDCIDHPWGFHRVDTFYKLPVMGKVDTSRKYINKVTKEEIGVTPAHRSLTISFLDSPDQYLYTISINTLKYIKHEI